MDSAVTWNVNQNLMMGLALGIFGFLGFRRGVNRELLLLIGIALAIWVSSQFAPVIGPQVNRFYKIGRFALSGGLTSQDPTAAWQETNALPDLVHSEDVSIVGVVLFVLIASYFYYLSQRRFPDPTSAMLKLLGAFAGLVNGFLVTYYLFPIVFSGTSATINLPSGEVQQTLTSQQTIAQIVAFLVFVLIALGLHSATPPRNR